MIKSTKGKMMLELLKGMKELMNLLKIMVEEIQWQKQSMKRCHTEQEECLGQLMMTIIAQGTW